MGRVDLEAAARQAEHSDADIAWLVLDLVDELRLAREAIEACRPVLARHGGHIRDNGLDDWDPDYRYEVEPPPHVLAARESLAAYDQTVQHLNDPGSERDGE